MRMYHSIYTMNRRLYTYIYCVTCPYLIETFSRHSKIDRSASWKASRRSTINLAVPRSASLPSRMGT